jgi:hypothetical protein
MKSASKAHIKSLVNRAAKGDEVAIRELLQPFIADDEQVLQFGLTAKLGLIPSYDFAFLTDEKIGDLQITPLTGNISVEVARLKHIDAYHLSQPAFPILLRLLLVILYAGAVVFPLAALEGNFVIAIPIALCLIAFVHFAVWPALKYAFLRFKKSGLWCKVGGFPIGVLIFADRNQFEFMTRLARNMTIAASRK